MKYLDGFRNGKAAKALTARLKAAGERLDAQGKTVQFMEVCGSHTMAIARYGIRDLLPDCVKLISGPGCPVCVTDTGYIDAAIDLGKQGHILATFGDLVRVPGSDETLAQIRAEGARVEVVYSPEGAVALAQDNPEKQIVFLAIGFETTMVPGISLVKIAAEKGLDNLTVLCAFKLVPPALAALGSDPEINLDGFICPAHVSVIIGADAYKPFVGPRGVPCVVAGFEPLDVLYAAVELAEQAADGRAELVNQYNRVVKPGGNKVAQAVVAELLELCDEPWRGIGVIPESGMQLREAYAAFDAVKRFGLKLEPGRPHPGCQCGEVLKGKITPQQCPAFDKGCTPTHPLGPCMVSSEGSCAAYYKYVRREAGAETMDVSK